MKVLFIKLIIGLFIELFKMKTSNLPNLFKLICNNDDTNLSKLEKTITKLYNKPDKLVFIKSNIPTIIKKYKEESTDKVKKVIKVNICPFCTSERGCMDHNKGNSFKCMFSDDNKYRICYRITKYYIYLKIHLDIEYELINKKFKIISIIPILNKEDMLDTTVKHNFPFLTDKKVEINNTIKMSEASKEDKKHKNENSEKLMKLQKRLLELKEILEEKERYHLQLLCEATNYDVKEINPSDELKYKIDFIY